MVKLYVLQAMQGDCFIIKYGEHESSHYIIIDGGMGKECTRELNAFISKIKIQKEKINLVILTHYDADHIQGFLNLAKDSLIDSNCIEKIWFNYGEELSNKIKSNKKIQFNISETSCETTRGQGKDFYDYITQKGIDITSFIKEYQIYDIYSAKIKILSPSLIQLKRLVDEIGATNGNTSLIENDSLYKDTAKIGSDYDETIDFLLKKEYSEKNVTISNFSSIAFLFEYMGHKILFMGDAVSSQVLKVLTNLGYSQQNKLKLDYCKISHHGSNSNTSPELIKILDCSNYIISSNWTRNRPGKACLSRIVENSKQPVCFYCNYQYKNIFTVAEKEKYNMKFEIIPNNELVLEE